MVRLIIQSIFRRKLQAFATVAGIAIGVTMVMTVALAYTSIQQGVEAGQRRLGADLLVLPNNAGLPPETALFTGVPANFYMPEDIKEQVASLPGVKQVSAQFYTQTLDESCCSLGGPYRLIGFDPQTDWMIATMVGREACLSLGNREVLIGGNIFGKAGQDIIILDEPFTIAHVLPLTGTGLDESILMPMASAKDLAKASPELQAIWQKEGSPDALISSLLVITDSGADLAAISEAIETMGRYRVVPTLSLFSAIKDQFALIVAIVFMCGLLLVAGSLLQLIARLSSMVWERKAEWGLYRTLGASRFHLFKLIAGEGLIMSAVGAGTGLLGGGILYKLGMGYLLTKRAFPYLPPAPAFIGLSSAVIMLFFVTVSLVACWFAARSAAGMDPAVAMAKGDID